MTSWCPLDRTVSKWHEKGQGCCLMTRKPMKQEQGEGRGVVPASKNSAQDHSIWLRAFRVHMVFDPYHAAPEKPWISNEFSKLAGDCPITALTRQSMTLTWQITPLKRHRMMDYVQKTGSLSCHRFSYQLDHPGFCGQGGPSCYKKSDYIWCVFSIDT